MASKGTTPDSRTDEQIVAEARCVKNHHRSLSCDGKPHKHPECAVAALQGPGRLTAPEEEK